MICGKKVTSGKGKWHCCLVIDESHASKCSTVKAQNITIHNRISRGHPREGAVGQNSADRVPTPLCMGTAVSRRYMYERTNFLT